LIWPPLTAKIDITTWKAASPFVLARKHAGVNGKFVGAAQAGMHQKLAGIRYSEVTSQTPCGGPPSL
jgi:hypothetical protein